MADPKITPAELAEQAAQKARIAFRLAGAQPDGALMAVAESVALIADAMAAEFKATRLKRIHDK
jgi:hypothetical protein